MKTLRTSTVLCLLLSSPAALAQSTALMSLDSGGQPLADASLYGSISEDGRFVAFISNDPNVVPGDINNTTDVFVRDLATGQVVRASVTATGVEANGPCFMPELSADGKVVAFTSWATNLATTDANGTDADVFVKDLATGALAHASRSTAGAGGDGSSAYHDLSADGRFVTWYSYSTNLVPNDTNGNVDVFLHDRVTQQTERVSVATGGAQLALGGWISSISGDGRFVAFEAFSGDLGFAMETRVVALRDRAVDTTTVLTLDPGGTPVFSDGPVIAANGRSVAFHSAFSLVPADSDFQSDVYVVDVASLSYELISAVPSGASPGGTNGATSLSSDGRFVAFQCSGALDPQDANGKLDVYVADRDDGTIELVSIGFAGLAGNDHSGGGELSGDGRRVVFFSEATDIVANDGNGDYDVFLRERYPSASFHSYGAGFPGTGGVVPSLTLSAAPSIGTSPSLQIGNSAGIAAAAVVVFGPQQASLPTPLGGTLLVNPLGAASFALPAAGLAIPFAIPADVDLIGAKLDLQALIADAGATHGVAFSAGLEATIGS